VRVDRFAVAVGEHPLVAGVDADSSELGGLVGPPPFDGAAGGLGLVAGLVNPRRCATYPFVADLLQA
jgi:hypothetical protein